MSKFEEICQAYSQARRTFNEYEETCREFARDLVYGMIDYFEWPQDQEVTYIPLGEELDPNNKFYALAGAMQMDDDSFWHFGVELSVYASGGAYHKSFVISFFIKKIGQNFIVKLGQNGREIKIPESQKDNLQPFYEAVFLQIKNFFARDYIKALTGQETEFGFITLL
ncbi:MAG: hypothetical protein AAF614_33770, partial [Chloroflexota bacterium]